MVTMTWTAVLAVIASMIPLLQPAGTASMGVLAPKVEMAVMVDKALQEAKEPLAALVEIAETALMLATVLADQMAAMVSTAEPEQMEMLVVAEVREASEVPLALEATGVSLPWLDKRGRRWLRGPRWRRWSRWR